MVDDFGSTPIPFPISFQPYELTRLLAIVGDETVDIPLREPQEIDDSSLARIFEVRYGRFKASKMLESEELRERFRWNQWLREFATYTGNKRLLSTFVPLVRSREDLRDRLRESMVLDNNRRAYFSFLELLVETTPRDVVVCALPRIGSISSDQQHAFLQREYDQQYLRVFVDPVPSTYTKPCIVR